MLCAAARTHVFGVYAVHVYGLTEKLIQVSNFSFLKGLGLFLVRVCLFGTFSHLGQLFICFWSFPLNERGLSNPHEIKKSETNKIIHYRGYVLIW